MGGHLSPQYGHVILVGGYTILTAVSWPQHGYAIQGCRLPDQQERLTFNVGFPVVRTDRRSGGRTVTWLPKFDRWIDYHSFLGVGLRSRARGAPLLLCLLVLNVWRRCDIRSDERFSNTVTTKFCLFLTKYPRNTSMWKVWTQESFQKSVEFDRLGERSPE